ncbi:FAD-dependent monooxygenase [Actinokineospora soli]|uniref:FAD-dependent monooxygenase n=1 Tax=Actinokineospora soli TaxID=1048753 RepID=A0ABW2TFW8_9PSEU
MGDPGRGGARGAAAEDTLAVGVGTSLTGEEFHRESAPIAEDAPQSPTYAYICAQDKFEVVLRSLAESLPGTDIRFGVRMESLAQDDSGVTATMSTGEVVRASYCIAADGARSGIRAELGIGVEGPPVLGHMISIMFDADFVHLLKDRMCALYFLRSAIPCAVEAVDNKRRWMIQTGYDPAEGGSEADFTPEFCVEVVRAAVGIPDLPVELVGVMPWLQQAVTATSFRSGRVFLAGDAAHVSTPQGGFGMNCGIQDVHNLVWKLARVLRGTAGAALLDTYESERHPIGARTVHESLMNALITFRMMEGELSLKEAIEQQASRRSSEGLVLGFHYDSAAVLDDGTPAPTPDDPYRSYVPIARPGHRAPHVWLTRDGAEVSTLDLIGPGFTLLTPKGSGWRDAAAGLDVEVFEISADIPSALTSPTWAKEYGLTPTGAVLIRPDGHVAWRTAAAEADPAALRDALGKLLARS